MTQKQLKEIYMNEIKRGVYTSDKRMQDYMKSQCGFVVQLENGDIFCLEKPSIKKDFCFGMGMYARATEEDEQIASDLAHNARTNQNYFIKENMKEINKRIDRLNECIASPSSTECYSALHYSGQPDDSKIMAYMVVDIFDNPEHDPRRFSSMSKFRKLNAEEIEQLIAGYQELKKTFEKRLHTYLKRYGLSKLNVWTYYRD